MDIADYLAALFYVLKNAGYHWQPQSPDHLLELRKNFKQFRPLIQWFGLGQPVTFEELIQDGLAPSILQNLSDLKLVQATNGFICSVLAISNCAKNFFILHSHWPPEPNHADEYVYFGPESIQLVQKIDPHRDHLRGKNILDLGCSSGGVSINLDAVAQEVLGIDRSKRAIAWAHATACAYEVKNIHFEQATIGESDAEKIAGQKTWDVAIINPPMAIPSGVSYPHRDGGKYGIEMPLKFIDFGYRHLKSQGEVFSLITNPIVGGKSLFFEKFESKWEIIEKQCLHEYFNQSIARKEGYDKLGIQKIELWFLHLRKK